MEVKDIMSQPAFTMRAYGTVTEAAELMEEHNVGCLPICEDGKIIGIVTDRDIVLRCLAPGMNPHQTEVHTIMSLGPVTISPDAPLEEAARIFGGLRVRRLPVVVDDRPVGMLALDDMARFWNEDDRVLLLVRRAAPRRRERGTHAA